LSALDEWLDKISITEDPEGGTVEVVPRSTGTVAEWSLEVGIRSIQEALRLAASKNETIELIFRDDIPEDSDLASLWLWAKVQRKTCRDVLQFVKTKPPKRKKQRSATIPKRRWSCDEVDEHIKTVLDSEDQDLIQQYLFATAHQLGERIKCDRKTVLKTEFWKEQRDERQADWRRNNAAQPKKSSSQ
jgi:hypothetical protein